MDKELIKDMEDELEDLKARKPDARSEEELKKITPQNYTGIQLVQ